MILNIKIVAALFVLLMIAALVLAVNGEYILAVVCIFGLGLLSSHMKRYEKFYESEIDELYPDDELL